MCMRGKDLWSSYVEPSNAVGHFGGNASGESCYLLVDVHEKSVRGPLPLLMDSVMWDAIKVHGHCATSMKRMAADAGWWETLFVNASGNNGCF